MRGLIFTLGVAFFAAGETPAQPPPVPADPGSNFARAYRHFLNSPYTYRTLSSSRPGFTEVWQTPWSQETYSVDPDYLQLRVTPWGYEEHTYVPGYGGSLATPWAYDAYRVPGYFESRYAPPAAPPAWAPTWQRP